MNTQFPTPTTSTASIGNRDGIVTIASTRTGNYIFGAGYYHFNIAPKKLTMGASVTEKKYDGLTDAVVKPRCACWHRQQ